MTQIYNVKSPIEGLLVFASGRWPTLIAWAHVERIDIRGDEVRIRHAGEELVVVGGTEDLVGCFDGDIAYIVRRRIEQITERLEEAHAAEAAAEAEPLGPVGSVLSRWRRGDLNPADRAEAIQAALRAAGIELQHLSVSGDQALRVEWVRGTMRAIVLLWSTGRWHLQGKHASDDALRAEATAVAEALGWDPG